MKEYSTTIDGTVSIGLGDGDNRQAAIIAEIVKYFPGNHINQIFPVDFATTAGMLAHTVVGDTPVATEKDIFHASTDHISDIAR